MDLYRSRLIHKNTDKSMLLLSVFLCISASVQSYAAPHSSCIFFLYFILIFFLLFTALKDKIPYRFPHIFGNLFLRAVSVNDDTTFFFL